jgi:hypothetical protein
MAQRRPHGLNIVQGTINRAIATTDRRRPKVGLGLVQLFEQFA